MNAAGNRAASCPLPTPSEICSRTPAESRSPRNCPDEISIVDLATIAPGMTATDAFNDAVATARQLTRGKIGRASCRERVDQVVEHTVVAVTITKNMTQYHT